MPASQYYSRSTEIEEIIGQVPSWTIRWGITVLLSVLLILLFCSYQIQYPDFLPASVVITTKEQPFRISWYRNGPHVHKVYVKEGQFVNVGDTLVTEQSLVNGAVTPIISATKGRVIFLKGTEENPRKMTIVVYPPLSEHTAQLYLTSKGAGKVRPGQKVLIRLDVYPAEDFGMLEGKVVSIFPVPIDDKYRAEVRLVKGLVTTENKEIPARHLMSGNGEVLIDSQNLFMRIFGSVFR